MSYHAATSPSTNTSLNILPQLQTPLTTQLRRHSSIVYNITVPYMLSNNLVNRVIFPLCATNTEFQHSQRTLSNRPFLIPYNFHIQNIQHKPPTQHLPSTYPSSFPTIIQPPPNPTQPPPKTNIHHPSPTPATQKSLPEKNPIINSR
jgi:hypothetical protein